MTAREKENIARYYLTHVDEIKNLLHQKKWDELLVILKYAEQGIPKYLARSDQYLYRGLCAGLTEFVLRGYDLIKIERIEELCRHSPVA